ncbi:MAG TPA: universal stress protein [Acidimicrobiales bacterium]|nr:universal stress protein [Acidimicrobiales bacterium]
MKKILVATDGSEGAAGAVAWAGGFAAALHAKVVLATVIEPHTAESELEAGAGQLPAAWTEPLRDAGVDHEPAVLEGDARAELLRLAGGDIDAVVLGTRGSGGFQGLGLGGTTHYLARRTPCPLIAVPAPGGPLAGGTVIVGADTSKANEPALAWACGLARDLGGRVVALFVHSPLADVQTHPADNWTYRGEADVRAHVAERCPDAEVVLRAGSPVEELARLGAELDAGLLVTGRRGRGGLHGLLLGRVPAQLLHHAGRPVAVIGR